MAFGAGGGKGRVRSDINITPLVDVVLVLLIIFMVMTPVLLKKMDLQVPEKVDSDVQTTTSDQVVLSIAADGTVAINKEPVPRETLGTKMTDVLHARREKVVFFDIDDRANYSEVVKIMDDTRGAGAKVLGIMTP
ncbi:MAG: biopolymer transporter ExbD [Myxococcota bacterium]